MTKIDDVLLELNRSVNTYMKSIPIFQYNNAPYRLIDNYSASPYVRCDVCGCYPVTVVSVLEGSDSRKLRLCNQCIDILAGQRISECFNVFRAKRQNILFNRKLIDQLSLMLDDNIHADTNLQLKKSEFKDLQKILKHLCDGQNLTSSQIQLVDNYLQA
ncbi:MAG: hypothetical protein IAX22_08200 [Candidatus Bathyarchaeota archaeon]|nr:hypothetical protein [Thermoproteota archaeon]MDT8782605.1 hypothetical protein [Candidatus Bathyarchaeota archaeon]NLD65350.1 hypothetical protein [Thermoproteota archaeon]